MPRRTEASYLADIRNQLMHNAVNRRVKRLREQGRRAAKARWRNAQAKRDRLAALDPIRVGGRILERWVRIINETVVRERTIFEFDRPGDVRRKHRELFA